MLDVRMDRNGSNIKKKRWQKGASQLLTFGDFLHYRIQFF
jgi:hypothetical protein